jgi:hypothetical protein
VLTVAPDGADRSQKSSRGAAVAEKICTNLPVLPGAAALPNMNTDEFHTREEVAQAFRRLRSPVLLKLAALARNWVRKSGHRDADDLLAEAFTRALAGTRRWPVGVTLLSFMNGVMKSVADAWGDQEASAALVDLDEATLAGDGGRAAGEFQDALAKMQALLAFDREARGILEGLARGSTKTEIMADQAMDETTYDTARRRMARVVSKAFGPDWRDKV